MTRDENRRFDEESIGRAFKDKMGGLDEYIPPAPPFGGVEAAGARRRRVSAGSPASVGPGRLRRASGLLAAAAVVAIIVAAVVVPRAILPVANPTPTPSVAPSPTATVMPSSVQSPQVIYGSFAAGVAWSPDGTKLAFTDNADQIHVLSADGAVIEILPGREVAWVDDTTVAVLGSDSQAYSVRLRLTDNGARTPIGGKYAELLGSSGGHVALLLAEQGRDGYKMWSPDSGLSARRDGLPAAFSPDGSKLAVVHYPEGCCVGVDAVTPAPGKPNLDVTDVATGKSLAARADVARTGVLGYLISFSPDGSRIAFVGRAGSGTNPVVVLDVATSKEWVVQPGRSDVSEEVGQFLWLDSSHLEIGPWPSGTPPAGMPVAVFYGNNSSYDGATSSRGTVARIASGRTVDGGLAGSPKLTLTSAGGSAREVDLDATAWELHWNPDGSALAVVCGPADGAGGTGWSVVLVRP